MCSNISISSSNIQCEKEIRNTKKYLNNCLSIRLLFLAKHSLCSAWTVLWMDQIYMLKNCADAILLITLSFLLRILFFYVFFLCCALRSRFSFTITCTTVEMLTNKAEIYIVIPMGGFFHVFLQVCSIFSHRNSLMSGIQCVRS